MTTRRNAIKSLCAGTLGAFGINKVSAEVASWKEMDIENQTLIPQENEKPTKNDVKKWFDEDFGDFVKFKTHANIEMENKNSIQFHFKINSTKHVVYAEDSSPGENGMQLSKIIPSYLCAWTESENPPNSGLLLMSGFFSKKNWDKLVKTILASEIEKS